MTNNNSRVEKFLLFLKLIMGISRIYHNMKLYHKILIHCQWIYSFISSKCKVNNKVLFNSGCSLELILDNRTQCYQKKKEAISTSYPTSSMKCTNTAASHDRAPNWPLRRLGRVAFFLSNCTVSPAFVKNDAVAANWVMRGRILLSEFRNLLVV